MYETLSYTEVAHAVCFLTPNRYMLSAYFTVCVFFAQKMGLKKYNGILIRRKGGVKLTERQVSKKSKGGFKVAEKEVSK